MKRIQKIAMAYLIIGLLLTLLMPIVSRYFELSDFLKGFLKGLGLPLEIIGIIKLQSAKKNNSCSLKKHTPGINN